MSLPREAIEKQEMDDPTFRNLDDINRRTQLQAFLLNQFKSRWRHEYLTSLREHHRTSGQNTQTVKPDDVVLIHDDTPWISWKLAVIEELLKGKDGLVRAANIRTTQGGTNRPIARLIPLEVSSEVATTGQNITSPEPSDNTSVEPVEGTDQPRYDLGRMERPRRAAALRGREKVVSWTKQLDGGPPEDVMN